MRYRSFLESLSLAAATVNLHLSTIRRPADESAESGVVRSRNGDWNPAHQGSQNRLGGRQLALCGVHNIPQGRDVFRYRSAWHFLDLLLAPNRKLHDISLVRFMHGSNARCPILAYTRKEMAAQITALRSIGLRR